MEIKCPWITCIYNSYRELKSINDSIDSGFCKCDKEINLSSADSCCDICGYYINLLMCKNYKKGE